MRRQGGGGSNFTTIVNQLAFMTYPKLAAYTAASTFDPVDRATGDTDLLMVAPEELLGHVRGWIRPWIPNAVPARRARDLLVVLDEMLRFGYLKPVMDGMAAGREIQFWSFVHSALDATWGKEHQTKLTHLAEVLQVLEFPRADGAEELSNGSATWESRSENVSYDMQHRRSAISVVRAVPGRRQVKVPDDEMT